MQPQERTERLERLACDGDNRAKALLERERSREGSVAQDVARAESMRVRQERGEAFSAVERAWFAIYSETQRDVDIEGLQYVEDLLARVQRKRRVRLLTLSEVAEAIIEALQSKKSYATRNGGSVPGGYAYEASTTVCLVYARRTRVVVGIESGSARSPSPGRTWPQLQPWRERAALRTDVMEWARGKDDSLVCVRFRHATKR